MFQSPCRPSRTCPLDVSGGLLASRKHRRSMPPHHGLRKPASSFDAHGPHVSSALSSRTIIRRFDSPAEKLFHDRFPLLPAARYVPETGPDQLRVLSSGFGGPATLQIPSPTLAPFILSEYTLMFCGLHENSNHYGTPMKIHEYQAKAISRALRCPPTPRGRSGFFQGRSSRRRCPGLGPTLVGL